MARPWQLWRRKTGRHALGAAVTELPSGPPTAVAAPSASAAVLAAAPEPGLAASIAELIASGEAWSVPAAQLPDLPPPVLPLEPPDVPPAAAPPAAAPARDAPPTAAEPALARVQLGFRDGTSTALDPSSSQSLALEQLAHSLTHRD